MPKKKRCVELGNSLKQAAVQKRIGDMQRRKPQTHRLISGGSPGLIPRSHTVGGWKNIPRKLVIFLYPSLGDCFGHVKERMLRETDLGLIP